MRTARPIVTVAMAAYNAEATLQEAVGSILGQTLGDFELIVADDGSTDRTAALLLSFTDPRIRVLTDGKNAGKPTRMNQIIECAKAPFLAIMDSDDVSYPDRLERQVEFLTRNSGVDLLAGGMSTFDHAGRLGLWRRLPAEHDEIVRRPWLGFHFNSPTWMGRTEWFRRFGYRSELRAAEDEDLLLRSYRHSRFAGLERILVAYRIDQWSWRKARRMRRDHVRAIARAVLADRDLRLLPGFLLHAANLIREAAAVVTGSQQRVLDYRMFRLEPEQELELKEILRGLPARESPVEVPA